MLKIDKWYKTEKVAKIDCFFYPNSGLYRGNLYNEKGKIIGDYFGNDSTEIEKRFSRFIKF